MRRIAFLTGFALVWFPLALMAQDVDPVAPAGSLRTLVLLGITYASGVLSKKSYDGLKTIIPPFDKLPAKVHMVGAPLFGFAFGAVAAGLTAAQLLDVDGPAAPLLGGVVNALVMGGQFRLEKTKQPVDGTVAVESTRVP